LRMGFFQLDRASWFFDDLGKSRMEYEDYLHKMGCKGLKSSKKVQKLANLCQITQKLDHKQPIDQLKQ
jgi:hypothetical protein